MTDTDAIAWCRARQATVHFRRRSRVDLEVLLELPDDITATAATLELAIEAVERKRRAAPPPLGHRAALREMTDVDRARLSALIDANMGVDPLAPPVGFWTTVAVLARRLRAALTPQRPR